MLFSVDAFTLAWTYTCVVAISIVTVVGAIANLVVVIAVLGDKQLRSAPMNLLLASLVGFCRCTGNTLGVSSPNLAIIHR